MNRDNQKGLKKTKCTKRCSYGKENLYKAISEVRNGKSIASASKHFAVPESTIRARVQGKYQDKKPGPNTILSIEEENKLVQWVLHCAKQGFPVTKSQLLESVHLLVIELKRPNNFTNDVPGRHWYEGFLRRHCEISKRLSENVGMSRAKVTESGIRNWFQTTKKYLESEGLLNINPKRLFNCDETGVALNPTSSTVLAGKGFRNVYKIVGNNEKENVTVLITVNAAGELAPPLLLFSGKKMPPLVQQNLPLHFSAGISDHGWMTAKNFYEYIANVFYPWLVDNEFEFPIILFIDGHSSHITLPLSTFCCEHKIILIALKANSTHILQPLDVAFFRTFKAKWQKKSAQFCRDNNLLTINKRDFANVLNTTLENMPVKKVLQNGFKICGLYPFDEHAVDYNKVFYRSSTEVQQEENMSNNNSKKLQDLINLENLLDKEKLIIFKSYQCRQWCGKKEDENLFLLWFDLASTVEKQLDNINQRENNIVNKKADCGNEAQGSTNSSITNNTQELSNTFTNKSKECDPLATYEIIEIDSFNLPITNDVINESLEQSIFLKNPVNENLDCINTSTIVNDIEQLPLHCVTNESKECDSSHVIIEHDSLNVPISDDERALESSNLEIIKISDDVINEMPEQSMFLENVVNEKLLCTNASTTVSDIEIVPLNSVTNETKECDPTHEDMFNMDNIQTEKNFNNNSIVYKNENIYIESKINTNKPECKRSPLSNLSNLNKKIKLESSPAFQKVLFWPGNQLETKPKRNNGSRQEMPSVLTSEKWREIKIQQEEKKKKAEEAVRLRKTIKLEKQETKKLKQEQMILNKIRKEELNSEKNTKRLQKQKEKIEQMENAKRKKEEELKKKKKYIQVKIDLGSLKYQEEELLRKQNALGIKFNTAI